MPVLGLIFLRYAYSRFKMVEAEILKNRPMRGGHVLPVESSDFVSKSALFLPREAQYEYLVNLPADIASAGLTNQSGHTMNSLGEVVNNAMELLETQSEQLTGVLPKDYTMPNVDTLHRFQQEVKPIFDAIRNKQLTNHYLAEAHDRLLPKLMSGEMEV